MGGRKVEPFTPTVEKFGYAPAGDNGSAFFSRELVVRENLLTMLFGNQRTRRCGFIGRPAEPQVLSLLFQCLDKTVENRTLHINALGTQAHLTGIQKNGIRDPAERLLEIAVRE